MTSTGSSDWCKHREQKYPAEAVAIYLNGKLIGYGSIRITTCTEGIEVRSKIEVSLV